MSLDCETIERSESLPVGTHSLSVAGTPVTALHAPTAPKAASPRGRALCAGSALWVSFAARGFGSHDRGAWAGPWGFSTSQRPPAARSGDSDRAGHVTRTDTGGTIVYRDSLRSHDI
jgi:hypothetical protein